MPRGILPPVTQHEAFDLVACRRADRHGVQSLSMDQTAVDVVGVYCPDTGCCYYIDPRRHRAGIQLRIDRPRNGHPAAAGSPPTSPRSQAP